MPPTAQFASPIPPRADVEQRLVVVVAEARLLRRQLRLALTVEREAERLARLHAGAAPKEGTVNATR